MVALLAPQCSVRKCLLSERSVRNVQSATYRSRAAAYILQRPQGLTKRRRPCMSESSRPNMCLARRGPMLPLPFGTPPFPFLFPSVRAEPGRKRSSAFVSFAEV
jgi:hypothetical protein